MSQTEKDTQEEFCGACVAPLMAAAAVGGGVAGASTAVDRQKHKKLKKTMFVVGITIAVLSILYSLYIIYKEKKSGGLAVCSK